MTRLFTAVQVVGGGMIGWASATSMPRWLAALAGILLIQFGGAFARGAAVDL